MYLVLVFDFLCFWFVGFVVAALHTCVLVGFVWLGFFLFVLMTYRCVFFGVVDVCVYL